MKKRIFKVLILSLIIVQIMSVNIFAFNLTDIFRSGDEFINGGNVGAVINEGSVTGISNNVTSIFYTIGIIVSVIIVSVLGIKYMTGSIEEKVEVKKTLVPFTIGIIIIFGAFTIWSIVVNILQS